jgi:cytochrome o ubiquinol oxidase subunit 1
MTYTDLFGKLNLQAFQHDMIVLGASIMMALMALGAMGYLTIKRRWKWLLKEWIFSVDPKKIGVMYFCVVALMLLKGAIDAVMMRAQLVFATGADGGYLTADHYQQLFTAHGTVMIFFVGMGIVFALSNLVIPLQIGARDVAFPFLNAVSFWLFFTGFLLLNASLAIGEFSAAGWVAYPPLSGIKYSPGVGVDYWIWSVQIAGIGSLLAGINFFVTIFRMRCPGMTFGKMPVFIWAMLACMILIIFAFPILTVTIGLLTLDRIMGMHFFTVEGGGNPMMYVNLIWAWGHPEVYILILPAFGIFSEVVATFSEKRLFGYVSMVWAIVAITVLSFIVWLHHFFTMGASPNVNGFFGAMTMLIAVPTGVKIFNWIFTMFRGRVHLNTSMLWFLGFVVIFTIGGLAGMLLSIAPVDFQVHNSLFLIAHFHSVIIGGVVFGFFSGITYWFPKVTGFKLEEKFGIYAFWCWFIGFLVAFMPLYVLGLMGVTRRLSQYDASTGWQPYFVVAGVGALIVACGIACQVIQVVRSIKRREENRDLTGDPWNGRTLEWSIPSPPPLYNFAILPTVHERDAFWAMKKQGIDTKEPHYEDILMPKDTPMGVIIGMCSFIFGFAIIWQIVWLVIVGFLGMLGCLVKHLSYDDTEYVIQAFQVEQIEKESLKKKQER